MIEAYRRSCRHFMENVRIPIVTKKVPQGKQGKHGPRNIMRNILSPDRSFCWRISDKKRIEIISSAYIHTEHPLMQTWRVELGDFPGEFKERRIYKKWRYYNTLRKLNLMFRDKLCDVLNPLLPSAAGTVVPNLAFRRNSLWLGNYTLGNIVQP